MKSLALWLKTAFVLVGGLLLLALGTTTAIAQSAKDSFLIKLQQHPQADTIRVELLVDACVNGTFSADTVYLNWAQEAIDLSEKLRYRVGKIRGLNCMGNFYYQRAIHDKALDYYFQALRMAEADGNENAIIIGNSNVANVYNRTNRSAEAVALFKACDALLVKRNDTLSEKRAAILTNLSTTFSTLGQHDSSIFYTQKVLTICEKKDIKFGIGLSLTNLASENYKLQNYRAALNYLDRANQVAKANGMDFLKGSIARYYGLSYLGIGETVKGIGYLQEALVLARSANNRETLTDVYKQLHGAYAKTGNFRAAYENSLLYNSLKDSIYGIEQEKTMRELSTRYETEKKEGLIKSLTQEKQITSLQSQRKTVLIYSLVAAALLITLLGYALFNRYKIKQQNKLLLEKIQHEQALNQSILTSIKAQMNPHFIFNALNTIQNFIYGNDKLKAAGYLGKFSELIRTVLHNSSQERISLDDEIKILNLYIELEKMRFENSIEVAVELDNIADMADEIMIPPMIIQPYIENAFKHGLLHKPTDRQLHIRVTHREADRILLWQIDDNGVGRTAAATIQRSNSHRSFATSATQKRLELLNEGRTNAIAVRVEDKCSEQGDALGTRVWVEMPYTTTF